MTPTFKTEGIILKRLNLGEADRILTLFSKHQGKLRLVAKGVRKTTSRKAGSLEPFSQIKLVAHRGRSFDVLAEVAVLNAYQSLRKNLTKVAVAYYFCELVDKLTADNQPHRDVYNLLVQFLTRLLTAKKLRSLVRQFEEQLLGFLGFGIPPEFRPRTVSLRPYLEEISEREINSPKILKA